MAGLYYAYRVRVIPLRAYDESKVIGFSMYNVGLVAIVIAILELGKVADRFALFGIRGVGIVLSACISIGAIMHQKFVMIRRGANARDTLAGGRGTTTNSGTINVRSASQSTKSSTGSEKNVEEELRKVEAEYKALLGEYTKVKVELEQLKARAAARGDSGENPDDGDGDESSSSSSDEV